jgi:hypothetical protein
MTPENIRHLLGELIVTGQRIASMDDVTTVEQWNALPVAVREWALESAKANLPKLIEDTHKQAADRVAKIQRVLDQLTVIESTDGDKLEVKDNVLPFPVFPGTPTENN